MLSVAWLGFKGRNSSLSKNKIKKIAWHHYSLWEHTAISMFGHRLVCIILNPYRINFFNCSCLTRHNTAICHIHVCYITVYIHHILDVGSTGIDDNIKSVSINRHTYIIQHRIDQFYLHTRLRFYICVYTSLYGFIVT